MLLPLLQNNLLSAAASGAFSSATTDGADVLAASVGVTIAASSATTDGPDVLAASISFVIAASSATTDGADVLAALIELGGISASSATTDGADVLAGNVVVTIAASSATTDGADTLVALVGVGITASSATADGADVLAALAHPVIAASSATTDGADVLVAYAETSLIVRDFSAAWTDGADVLAAEIGVPTTAGGIGFELSVKGAQVVSFKPLMQRIREAKQQKAEPATVKARKRAKSIVVEAAKLVAADGNESAFKGLMAQWVAQRPVVGTEPVIDASLDQQYQLFMAQVALRIQAIEDQEEEEAVIALLML